jgi:hypothetical protein
MNNHGAAPHKKQGGFGPSSPDWRLASNIPSQEKGQRFSHKLLF